LQIASQFISFVPQRTMTATHLMQLGTAAIPEGIPAAARFGKQSSESCIGK
jgi:hypothetical protein